MKHKYILSMLFVSCIIYLMPYSRLFAWDTVNTTISLWINYGFDATIALDDTVFLSWWVFYVNSYSSVLEITASTSSTYTILWDIFWSVSWSWSWAYTQTWSVTLADDWWIISVWWDFVAENNDRVQSNHLNIIVDMTAPTIPTLITPLLWSLLDDAWILFQRTPASDSESWVSHYEIVISTEPSMLNPITFSTSQTSLLINHELLPQWTLYRYIRVFDNVWNHSVSFPSYFVHTVWNNAGWNTFQDLPDNRWIDNDTLYEHDAADWVNNSVSDTEHWSAPDRDTLWWWAHYSCFILNTCTLPDFIQEQNWVTYIYPWIDQEQSIIELITRNNRLYILYNQQQDSHIENHHKKPLMIMSDWIWVDGSILMILPDYLPNTWASLWSLRDHFILIQNHFPHQEIKQQLQIIISFLTPKRYAWLFLFIVLIWYDIDSYNKRYKEFVKKS